MVCFLSGNRRGGETLPDPRWMSRRRRAVSYVSPPSVTPACTGDRRKRAPRVEAGEGKLDAVFQLFFFAFYMEQDHMWNTSALKKKGEKKKTTCCEGPSVSKTRLNNHICWVSVLLL